MNVRDARETDLPAIVEIVHALVSTTTIEWREAEHTFEERRAWLAQHQGAGDPVLVAESGAEIAGFACYSDFRDSKKWPGYRFVVEHPIHVRERYWKTGVGRTLIEALLVRAAEAGKRVMVGAVDGENVGSLRFHERCGFIEVARMPNIGVKLGRALTVVWLHLGGVGSEAPTPLHRSVVSFCESLHSGTIIPWSASIQVNVPG